MPHQQDNHAERNYRDVRIAPVWEGTTQIQALDLLGRKVMLGKLLPIKEHCAILAKQALPVLLATDSSMALRKRALSLLSHALEWGLLTVRIAMAAKSNPEVVSGSSEPYLMFAGHVSLASHWLKVRSFVFLFFCSFDALLLRWLDVGCLNGPWCLLANSLTH